MASVRILLIDDHPVVRAGLRGVLEAESDFQVVGEADTGAHGISLARTFRPDVVVTDLLLPDLDGVAVTQRIRDQLPDTHVVILTSVSDQAEWVGRAIRAGAMSFVMKDADIAELVATVRQAAEGRLHLSASAAARLLWEVRSPTEQIALTEREREVLREMAVGRTNKEIARSLDIALTTVKSHVRAIFDKLGVESRTQAALYAVRTRLVPEDAIRAA